MGNKTEENKIEKKIRFNKAIACILIYLISIVVSVKTAISLGHILYDSISNIPFSPNILRINVVLLVLAISTAIGSILMIIYMGWIQLEDKE